MEIGKLQEIGEALKGMGEGELVRWISEDEHEFIVMKDKYGNMYEIKAYVGGKDN